jgi:cytochrome c553
MPMQSPIAAPTLVALAALALPAFAQTPDVARSVAATCANCHGTGGLSRGENESLAGKPKDELVRKVQDYKQGRKPGTIMPQLAKGFTDEQIDLAAGWFSAQPAK